MPLLAGPIPRLKNRKPTAIQIDSFIGGSNVLFSETRLKKNEAKESTNLMLIEDGIWDKRWGTQQYGPTFDADIDGFCEYKKSDGTTELIVIADGKAWRTTDTTKTEITGATFTAGNACFFIQIGTNLYIGNGIDPIALYGGSTLSAYTPLTVPANLALTRGSSLSAGSYTYHYRVSAVNAVGETTPCTAVNTTVNEDRDLWSGDNDYINLEWDDVSNALKYVVYFADTSGYEVKLAETAVSTYKDLGTAEPNTYVEPPIDNTTGGPKLKSMTLSGNKIWGTEPDNPYRTYFSGSGVNLGNFSPAYGGGWIDLERGGKNTVVNVVDFQGNCHVLCTSDEGKGTIWEIVLESQTIGSTTFTVPIPTKLIGAVGTQSPLAVVLVENDVFFLNKRQIGVLGNEPGVLNVLRTNELSAKIRSYIQSLPGDSIDKACSYYYDAKVFFSVSTISGDPDRIIVYDREKMAWYKDWTIGVKQFGEYTDGDDVTRFLGSKTTKLIEFSPSFQGDDGVAFQQKYVSPRIPVSKDWTQFAKMKKTFIKLRNTLGSVNFKVLGTGKDEAFSSLKSGTISPGVSKTGWSWDKWDTFKWGTSSGSPTTFAAESLIRYFVLNKLIRDIQFVVSTPGNNLADRFVLTGLRAEGFSVPTGKPSDWKLS